MSFLPNAVDGKTHALKTEGQEGIRAMDRRDNWLETENCFFDATVSENEWTTDTAPRADEPTPDLSAVARSAKADARPAASESRVMVIGFHVIRV